MTRTLEPYMIMPGCWTILDTEAQRLLDTTYPYPNRRATQEDIDNYLAPQRQNIHRITRKEAP